MSKKENKTEQTEQKIVTKYDRKVQKRREQKEKEQRAKRRDTVIGVVVVAALVCLVLSFPIRSYLAIHETYVNVGGEDVSRVEFDYNYSVAYNNYINLYGSYMSYFGVDLTADLSTQMYSDTLSWKDFFDQMAVDNLKQTKALLAEAEAAGFTYDTTEEYGQFEESISAAAAEAGVSVKTYVQQLYGSYTTLDRISDYVKESMLASAFYNQKAAELAPGDEEIQAYYDSNTAEYDSVDYRVTTVKAELPTEPTDLADPVEETADTTDTASTDAASTDTTESTEEEVYEPSEAEIEKAMADALVLAEEAETKVAADGELQENITKYYTASLIQDWLFDDSRQAGDTTIIEDDTNHQYYVLAFEKRYLDETPSADVRVIITDEGNGQEILDEWKSGEATEESFAALCETYSIDASATEGGLIEGAVRSGMSEELSTWLFDEARAAGDTVSITSESDAYTYVMYYVGQNEPEWKLNIKNTLTSEAMTSYVEEIVSKIQVEDPKKNLAYLWVEEETSETESSESAAAGSTETAGAEGTESAAADTTEAAETESAEAESTEAAESTQAAE